jgi:predicted ABC-class ATPase
VWDHVPDDGRELVVTDHSAVKVRSEDGRAVSGVDISPYIGALPSGEPTAATNFMIRDRRMQALVAADSEPIIPFVDRIRELHHRLGVSTILVMGGSGDYFEHADTVIHMEAYQPRDVTAQAHRIAATHRTGRRRECATVLVGPRVRRLEPRTLDPSRQPGRVRVQARGVRTLVFGRGEVDLSAVEQLADPSQVRAIGWLLARLASERQPLEPIPWTADALTRLADGDWQWLTGRPDGDLALPRIHEVMAALNRLRGARLGATAPDEP